MPEGKVKLFSESRGIGVIIDGDSGDDIHFKASAVVDEVSTGDDVRFEVRRGTTGMTAINISRL